ncbi:hypothetical protein Taro_046202 [Colocasia esculenta]|uniref:Dual specificity protein phosphatase PHS1 n=1 Tax=Colocasia esculenta TaxID=4460 RepID=A0A843X3U3_COLES|nr:hypothetical protein [Colocasia esculenta]
MPLFSSSAHHLTGPSSPISMSEEEAGDGPLEQREGEGNAEEVDPAPPLPPPPAIISPQVKSRQEAVSVATISSRVVSLLTGDAAGAGAAEAFEKWVALVRKRSGTYRCSGFPNRPPKLDPRMPCGIFRSSSYSSSESSEGGTDCSSVNLSPSAQGPETSLWERLGQAVQMDIDSSDFSWDTLSSLHHTEHTSSTEQSEDEMNKALEVTVNSGGVVFFGLFNSPEKNCIPSKEAAAVIKIASSRMATQSERLGYEFAKWLQVQTPQARVIHISSPEWQRIKDAADKARDMAIAMRDDAGEMTCTELVEALELSRCLFLMNYVHGSPLLENQYAFGSQEAAKRTAAALGRVLMLDLILRNEDRLPCRKLGWRGNSANLLFADTVGPTSLNALEDTFSYDLSRYGPSVIKALQKERRACSFDSRVQQQAPDIISQSFSELNDDDPLSNLRNPAAEEIERCDFQIVAIDSSVPRRPPAGKRLKDQTQYPKVVELLLNNTKYASELLCEISGGKLGLLTNDDDDASPVISPSCLSESDMMAVVNEFRGGFRAAFRDLQGFHLFLLSLYQKLDGLLRVFLSIIEKSTGETDKEDFGTTEIPGHTAGFGLSTPPPSGKERSTIEGHGDSSDSELHKTISKSSSGTRENSDSASPASRDNWHRCFKGSGEPRSIRLTMKLRDFHKFAKVDAEINKEIEQWNEMFRTDVIRLCQENNFNTGFFEGSDANIVVDAYELKVRLEHILERIALISDAANTERPSWITTSMFIGGALAARSVHTLQHLGISHVLCLCSNEIGQSDSQFPDLFEYKNFSISDNDDADIRNLFEEACNFIDYVEQKHGKVLVHCFEGRSRSATVVLAYLMLRKNFKLSEAWNLLKKVHRRAQPNDGFAKVLVEIDKNCHGTASMEWQHRRPMMKVCPICGKNAGLSSSSLKLHLQKAHRMISSGSVDSAMTLEIQKALDALQVYRGGSFSPTLQQQQSFTQTFD